MNLSKTRYCRGVQCKKILWLEQNKPEVKKIANNESIFATGNLIHEIAKYLFGKHINIEYNDDLNEMISNTLITIDSYLKVVITEASFKYLNNFCSVDILKKDGNSYEIYEVKSSTEVNDIYLDDISYQVFVLLNLGYNVTKASIIHINSDYVFYDKLNLDELFKKVDVTEIAFAKQIQIKDKIEEISDYMNSINEKVKPYPCPYFKYCTGHLPTNNIFNLKRIRNSKKFSLFNEGIVTYEDLLKIKLDKAVKNQIEFELYNKEDYIDIDNIKDFLSSLTYPLYFLDFETYQQSIPKFNGVRPYMQIPFQYSLHYIEEENDTLKHKEFLAEPGIDPRRSLAEKLVKDIPDDVCVLAYNMSFEKTVIKNLANLYLDLKDHLMNIYDNIKDLMIPFKNGWYYNKDMQGSYSIKYVLPALFPNDETLNYRNLDNIHNGSEAMNAYANMRSLSKNEQETLRNNLLEYCKLDTYAMVKIWERLKEINKIKEL